MKCILIIATFILTINLSWGQADTVFIKYNQNKFEEKLIYKTDTVIFDTPNARQILYGTTVLPWTLNQQIAKGYGFYLNNISITPCKQELGKRPDIKNEVVSINENGNNLNIEIKYWGNCCHSFLCDIEVKNENTLNLITFGYGATYCSCDCCFGLTYNFSTMKVDEYSKIIYVTINGDEKTKRKIK